MYKSAVTFQMEKKILTSRVDAMDSILPAWTKMNSEFNGIPSAQRVFQCSNNACRIVPDDVMAISPNFNIISASGFGAVKESLICQITDRISKCRVKMCNGQVNSHLQFNPHIFIELDIRKTLQSAQGIFAELRDFPPMMNLGNDKFRLYGAIGYANLHFVAYCYRNNGHWELYDDLKSKATKCTASTKICPHGLIYTRFNSASDLTA